MEPYILLPNGRKIGVAAYGNPSGHPLFFFHGTPSSRINPTVEALDALMNRTNVPQFRVIALDRPGYGQSDPQPDRSLQDWVEDTIKVADLLGVEKFALMGVSGGGPYAIAVSHGAPERVICTAVISGIGPLVVPELRSMLSAAEDLMLKAAEHAPEQLTAWANQVKANPAVFVNRIFSQLPEEQKRLVSDDMLASYAESLGEACRRPDGLISDYKIFGRPWNIPLSDIRTPIRFWHSDADHNVPIGHAEYLVNAIPGAELVRMNGMNHYTSLLAPLMEVLHDLAKEAD